MVTNKFEAYKTGIYKEFEALPIANHVVSITGWGFDNTSNIEYWIVRNSWGAEWGQMGFFYIVTSGYKAGHSFYNLGIEEACGYGDVIVDNDSYAM